MYRFVAYIYFVFCPAYIFIFKTFKFAGLHLYVYYITELENLNVTLIAQKRYRNCVFSACTPWNSASNLTLHYACLFSLHIYSFWEKETEKGQERMRGKKREKEELENIEESRKQDKMWHHHWKDKAQKHGAERRPYRRGKKSLVSLVSSTRLKGQMESQWGSLSGSHYWNRKGFFFLFTHTQSQSWKQLALRDSSVFLPNEWNKSVCECIHTVTYAKILIRKGKQSRYLTVEVVCVHHHILFTISWISSYTITIIEKIGNE